jgi:hypothetical protein
MVEIETGRTDGRRTGYCARRCKGHATRAEALAHQLQYQFDHELELGLERRSAPLSCEICGDVTTLRAQLGSGTPLFTLCWEHQSLQSVRDAIRRRETDGAATLSLGRVG